MSEFSLFMTETAAVDNIFVWQKKIRKINISRSPVAVLNLNMDVWEISEGYLREFEEHFRDKHTAFSFLDDQLQVYRVLYIARIPSLND